MTPRRFLYTLKLANTHHPFYLFCMTTPTPLTNPIITAPIATPFNANDHVDHDALQHNTARLLQTKLTGFIVGSATGEETFLAESEKIDITQTLAPMLDDSHRLIGGVDCPSVTESLRRAHAFANAGANLLRVRPPRDPNSVELYYNELLPRAPLPVLIMHQTAPQLFGQAPPPAADAQTLARIASAQNVFGYVTDHDLRFEAIVHHHITTPNLPFWVCNGSIILQGALIGANGTTTAFANIWPNALHDLLQLAHANQYDQAKPLQQTVANIDHAMLKPGPIGVKVALHLMGYQGMRPRLGLKPVDAKTIAAIKTQLQAAGLIEN